MSTQITYEASVYSRTVRYKNFKGVDTEVTLHFALDPLQLMTLMATLKPSAARRSGNPARRASGEAGITEEEQLKFIRKVANQAAGFPSDDGESWEPIEKFEETIAGKAFMTKLVTSDADRREFSEKVMLDPFRAFVAYAKADDSNSPKEVQEFETMLAQIETVFTTPAPEDETPEDRRARLEAELASLANIPTE